MSKLFDACSNGYTERVKVLLEETNLTFYDLNEALTIVSCSGYVSILQLLLNYKRKGVYADPNYQDKNGYTMLLLASHHRKINIVKFLLNYERKGFLINPYIKDNNGHTALSCAYSRHKEHNKEIIEILQHYLFFRDNIKKFIPSYNILLCILIKNRCKLNLPNEIILMIKNYGKIICGKKTY